MKSENALRPLGVLAGAVTAFSALLMLTGLATLGGIGYLTFGPGSDPVIVVSAKGGPDAPQLPEGVAAQAEADAAYYEAMRHGPDPYAAPTGPALPTIQTHASGLAEYLSSNGIGTPLKLALAALLFFATGYAISALAWVWRAHANLAASGIVSPHTPARAVAGYLIPGLNLVLPFEAMRELFNRSHGEPEELANASVDNVTAWWASSVIGLLIISALLVKFGLDLATNLVIMTPLWMEFVLVAFATLVTFGSTLIFASLVRTISAAQRVHLVALPDADRLQPAQARPAVRYVTRAGS